MRFFGILRSGYGAVEGLGTATRHIIISLIQPEPSELPDPSFPPEQRSGQQSMDSNGGSIVNTAPGDQPVMIQMVLQQCSHPDAIPPWALSNRAMGEVYEQMDGKNVYRGFTKEEVIGVAKRWSLEDGGSRIRMLVETTTANYDEWPEGCLIGPKFHVAGSFQVEGVLVVTSVVLDSFAVFAPGQTP